MVRKLVLLAFLLSPWLAEAKDVPKHNVGNAAFVNDFSNLLSPSEQQLLADKLSRFFDSTSNQMVVLIEPSLDGDDLFEYSLKVFREWGLGEKDKNNGLLLYITTNDRKMYIQVGYGLEGAIPDMLAKRVISNTLVPSFKQGAYYQGIDLAMDELMAMAQGEYKNTRPKNGFPTWIIVVIVIILIIIFTSFGSNMNRTYRSGRPFYDQGPFMGGGLGGFGGGGFGGFGGGGFGGFGGGSAGGGGAGGSW